MKSIGSQREELFLRRLIGDSGAVLQARELGPSVPISRDSAICAQFFRPWSLGRHIGYSTGVFSIKAPLSRIVAEGYADQVITALREAPAWLLRSLLWPHSVLNFLVAGDESAARAHLSEGRRWTLSGEGDWEAAGVYWATFFEEREMARVCFEKAAAGHLQRFQTDQASLAWNWLRICGDADCALRCLYADMVAGPTGGMVNDLAWHPLIAHADAWMALFERRDWAACYLEYASDAGAMGDAGGLFPAATAWMCILGEEKKAVTLAERGMSNKHESMQSACLYWYCVADDREKARQCLWSKEWSNYGSGLFRLNLARHILMFRGFNENRECQRHAEALITEVISENQTDLSTLCAAAELWANVVGAGAEDLLTGAAAQAAESCELFEVAETWRRLAHLPADIRMSGTRNILAHAEDIADNAIDYYFSAHSWRTLVGDEESAGRCLIKGEDCAHDPQDLSWLARGWTELLGRPADARRLVLEKSRTILLEE